MYEFIISNPKKEHCQTHMLTNNNLHIVRIGYKN